MSFLDTTTLTDISKLTRDEIVPYYVRLIKMKNNEDEVKRINQLILSRWSRNALTYIKEKAWRQLPTPTP